MDSVACFVGLDYHQDSVQVCVLDAQGQQRLNRACRNDWQAIAESVQGIGPVQGAAIEACGGAAHLAQELRDRAGWPVQLAHAGYVARLKQSPDKTDYSDGRLLADLTRVGYVPVVWLASPYERDLRGLVMHRQHLVNQRRAVKLRVGALLREHRAQAPQVDGVALSRWTKDWVAWARQTTAVTAVGRWMLADLLGDLPRLQRRIAAVEQQLRVATRGDRRVQALQKEAGIGEVTSWVLRAYVGPFERFHHGKQLSRYCGLSPANASSGAHQADAGLVQGCNKVLRATLIQAAHRLIRTQTRWQDFAQRLLGRGKPKNVVVAAVANRWIRGLWHRHRHVADGPAGASGPGGVGRSSSSSGAGRSSGDCGAGGDSGRSGACGAGRACGSSGAGGASGSGGGRSARSQGPRGAAASGTVARRPIFGAGDAAPPPPRTPPPTPRKLPRKGVPDPSGGSPGLGRLATPTPAPTAGPPDRRHRRWSPRGRA